MSDATAVIPVWNRRDLLARLFDTLDAQTQRFQDIVVIDNGSTDGAGQLAAQRGARVFRSAVNEGFAPAVNRGLRQVQTDLVAVLNSDVELHDAWLENLTQAMAPDIWFATGKLYRAGSTSILDGTFDLICRGACAWRAGSARPDSALFSTPKRIALPHMTATLFRTELFQQVGLLDERFESYLEDTDFGLRCAAAGRNGEYVPQAVGWHHGSASTGVWHPQTVRRIARNQVFLAAKHGSAWWPAFVAQSLWGAVALQHGALAAFVKGKWEGFRRRHEFSPDPIPREVWLQSEQELRDLQQKSGMDNYWRLYFWFTPGSN